MPRLVEISGKREHNPVQESSPFYFPNQISVGGPFLWVTSSHFSFCAKPLTLFSLSSLTFTEPLCSWRLLQFHFSGLLPFYQTIHIPVPVSVSTAVSIHPCWFLVIAQGIMAEQENVKHLEDCSVSNALGTWVFSVAGALLAIPVGIKRKSLAPLVFFGTTGTMLDIIMGISACEREHAERQMKLLEAQNAAAETSFAETQTDS
ncbi:hypothetical protein L6164_030502 [Bauhinia variegata]|uniref:Uncharacterized protein n=1 Tax=Bauhinia variegata TaxID=167791 RepID=A0ACB9LCX2_BAUVA|nr:hypothetical protein L6164_030502 [Bauhinia variegata]